MDCFLNVIGSGIWGDLIGWSLLIFREIIIQKIDNTYAVVTVKEMYNFSQDWSDIYDTLLNCKNEKLPKETLVAFES